MLPYAIKKPKDIFIYEAIYTIVRMIPSGRVATYGQIASIAGKCTPRMVGYAMANLPFNSDVPWHRVINRKGEISVRADGSPSEEERYLLETEGVTFDKQGRVDLEKVRWHFERLKDSEDDCLLY